MSTDPEWPQPGTLERRLLESAKGDLPPARVDESWARFARALAASLAHVDEIRPEREGGRAAAAGTTAREAAFRLISSRAVVWLVIGAVGGGALTAGAIISRRRPTPDDGPATLSTTAPPTAASRAPEPTARPPSSITSPIPEAPRRPSPSGRGAPPHARSTLAEEVARLDTARMAIANADPEAAIAIIDRYHHDFPRGALARDAEVLALEATAAKGDRAEAARHAQSFLSHYPNDPQAARVRSLAGVDERTVRTGSPAPPPR